MEATGSGQPIYSIGAVARMLGVPAATLRTWQERYGVVVPGRSTGGHRLYSRDQVEQLRFMVNQVSAGFSPADAHRMLRERLEAGGALTADEEHQRTPLVLLAERDTYAAEFSDYFLRTEGYEVTVALDLDEALATAQQNPPDLVVIDLMISAGRGLELCRRLAEQHKVPILAICTLGLQEAAEVSGAAAFLTKPIEPLQLVSAVRDLLLRPPGEPAVPPRGPAAPPREDETTAPPQEPEETVA